MIQVKIDGVNTDWNTFLGALPAVSPLPFALHSQPCCRLDLSAGNAALQGFESPVAVARAIMDWTPHVMLAGEGAARGNSDRIAHWRAD